MPLTLSFSTPYGPGINATYWVVADYTDNEQNSGTLILNGYANQGAFAAQGTPLSSQSITVSGGGYSPGMTTTALEEWVLSNRPEWAGGTLVA